MRTCSDQQGPLKVTQIVKMEDMVKKLRHGDLEKLADTFRNKLSKTFETIAKKMFMCFKSKVKVRTARVLLIVCGLPDIPEQTNGRWDKLIYLFIVYCIRKGVVKESVFYEECTDPKFLILRVANANEGEEYMLRCNPICEGGGAIEIDVEQVTLNAAEDGEQLRILFDKFEEHLPIDSIFEHASDEGQTSTFPLEVSTSVANDSNSNENVPMSPSEGNSGSSHTHDVNEAATFPNQTGCADDEWWYGKNMEPLSDDGLNAIEELLQAYGAEPVYVENASNMFQTSLRNHESANLLPNYTENQNNVPNVFGPNLPNHEGASSSFDYTANINDVPNTSHLNAPNHEHANISLNYTANQTNVPSTSHANLPNHDSSLNSMAKQNNVPKIFDSNLPNHDSSLRYMENQTNPNMPNRDSPLNYSANQTNAPDCFHPNLPNHGGTSAPLTYYTPNENNSPNMFQPNLPNHIGADPSLNDMVNQINATNIHHPNLPIHEGASSSLNYTEMQNNVFATEGANPFYVDRNFNLDKFGSPVVVNSEDNTNQLTQFDPNLNNDGRTVEFEYMGPLPETQEDPLNGAQQDPQTEIQDDPMDEDQEDPMNETRDDPSVSPYTIFSATPITLRPGRAVAVAQDGSLIANHILLLAVPIYGTDVDESITVSDFQCRFGVNSDLKNVVWAEDLQQWPYGHDVFRLHKDDGCYYNMTSSPQERDDMIGMNTSSLGE
eukprot:Colp12_sorted_trinity150504_noHs@27299